LWDVVIYAEHLGGVGDGEGSTAPPAQKSRRSCSGGRWSRCRYRMPALACPPGHPPRSWRRESRGGSQHPDMRWQTPTTLSPWPPSPAARTPTPNVRASSGPPGQDLWTDWPGSKRTLDRRCRV